MGMVVLPPFGPVDDLMIRHRGKGGRIGATDPSRMRAIIDSTYYDDASMGRKKGDRRMGRWINDGLRRQRERPDGLIEKVMFRVRSMVVRPSYVPPSMVR